VKTRRRLQNKPNNDQSIKMTRPSMARTRSSLSVRAIFTQDYKTYSSGTKCRPRNVHCAWHRKAPFFEPHPRLHDDKIYIFVWGGAGSGLGYFLLEFDSRKRLAL